MEANQRGVDFLSFKSQYYKHELIIKHTCFTFWWSITWIVLMYLNWKNAHAKTKRQITSYRIDPWWLTIFRVGQNHLYSFKERQVKAICWLKFSTFCQALFFHSKALVTLLFARKISKVIIRQFYLNQYAYF